MSSAVSPLPTFIIIGAQKSATRWLRFNLGEHPAIFAAPTELMFFNNRDRFTQLGAAGYRAMFARTANEAIVGEATPGYLFWRHQPHIVSERIEGLVPDVRLIAILRNPVDRAQSAMVHHMHDQRIPPGSDLLELVRATPPERDPLGLITGGWYAESLLPYMERFGDQLLVLLYDDARRDPRGAYERALRHVGAPLGFVPPELEKVRFSRQQGTGGNSRANSLTLEERRTLYEYFRTDIANLGQMLGRDLSMWDPENMGSGDGETA